LLNEELCMRLMPMDAVTAVIAKTDSAGGDEILEILQSFLRDRTPAFTSRCQIPKQPGLGCGGPSLYGMHWMTRNTYSRKTKSK
jgi:hypothetical protein